MLFNFYLKKIIENRSINRFYIYLLVFICFFHTSEVMAQGQVVTFETLKESIKKNSKEKIFYIKNGTYSDLTITLSGLEGIELKAQSPGMVKIIGNSQLTFINCHNVVFSGFHFHKTWSKYLIKLHKVNYFKISDNFFDQCKGNVYSRIIGMQGGSKYNTVEYNTFDGIRTMGVTISRDENYNNTIVKNVFKNIPSVREVDPKSKDGNGMEVISIGTVPYWDDDMQTKEFNTTISNNYFENILGDMNEIICIKANKNIIESNFFIKNAGGISLRFGNNNIVKKNVFIENGQNIIVRGLGQEISHNVIIDDRTGIQLPSSYLKNTTEKLKRKETLYFQAESILISDNTIQVSKGTPFLVGRHFSKERNLLPKDVIIENNRIYGSNEKLMINENYKEKLEKLRIRKNTFFKSNFRLINTVDINQYYYGKSW